MSRFILTRLLVLAIAAIPGTAAAYMGPGAGLGMLGSLIAVIAAVGIALLGIVLLPLRMIMKKRRKTSAEP
jgi:hypothetical protein